jgi:hypothetical protein
MPLSLKKFVPLAESANGHLKEAAHNTNLILGVSVCALVLGIIAVIVAVRH